MDLIKNIITGWLEPKKSLPQGNDFISYSMPYIVIRWTFVEHSLVIKSILNTGFLKFKIYNPGAWFEKLINRLLSVALCNIL